MGGRRRHRRISSGTDLDRTPVPSPLKTQSGTAAPAAQTGAEPHPTRSQLQPAAPSAASASAQDAAAEDAPGARGVPVPEQGNGRGTSGGDAAARAEQCGEHEAGSAGEQDAAGSEQEPPHTNGLSGTPREGIRHSAEAANGQPPGVPTSQLYLLKSCYMLFLPTGKVHLQTSSM